jgi:hypothetical protein
LRIADLKGANGVPNLERRGFLRRGSHWCTEGGTPYLHNAMIGLQIAKWHVPILALTAYQAHGLPENSRIIVRFY